MSMDATRWAWMRRGLRPSQKFVLLSLADRANECHACWPSLRRLSLDTGLDERTVTAAIRHMCDMGIISREETPGRGYTYALIGVSGGEGRPAPETSPPRKCAPRKNAGDPPQKRISRHIEEPEEEPGENTRARARERAPKPEKRSFGTFGNVRLTQEEHDRLLAEKPDMARAAIDKLDAYIGANGDRYASHYMAMFSWVFRAVEEDRAKRAGQARAFAGRQTLAERNLAVGAAWADRKRREMMGHGSTGS